MQSCLFVILFLLGISRPAQAFMNIEQLRQTAAQGTSGAVGLKLMGQTGNSEKIVSEASTLTLQRNGRDEYLVAGLYRYGESRRTKDTHLGNVHLRYTHSFPRWPAVETFGQMEFDQFKRLARRDLLGTGLRFAIAQREGSSAFGGFGFFWEQEHFQNAIPSERTVRANLYLSFVRTLNERVSANATIYYQPSVEGFGDTRLQVDSALRVSLAQHLALNLEWDLQSDSKPAPDVRKVDTSYLVGLSYQY